MTILNRLQESAFFSLLEDSLLENLATISTLKTIAKSSLLHYEIDSSSAIYFLSEGTIKVYKVDRFDNEVFLYHITKDNFISEITAFDEQSISCFANLEVSEDATIIAFEKQPFTLLYQNDNAFLLHLFKAFSARSKMMQCLINREIIFDGMAKVAFMLLYDLETFNRYKKQEVAYMLNIKPETLSRILKKLTRKAYIPI
jgi:CRP-like cAMP-binding protein